MYSEYWGSARRHQPDHRRYPVVEGDIPLPLGSTCRRKRLRSAGGDGEEGRSCASRPNPEGLLSANELSSYGQPEEEAGLQTLCHRCHIVTSQLRRQAAALKGPSCALNLLDELQRPQWYRRSRRDPVDTRCDICRGSFHQLRRPARCRPPKVSREMTPRLAYPSAADPAVTSTRPASVGIYGPEELPVKQQRWSYEEQLGGGDLWRGGGVHSTYLGGGGAKGLAAVTPLPLNPQDYLEGVWRVSSRSPEHIQHPTSWTSDAVYVTMKSLDVKPAAHSIATQTSRPPCTAAAFFIRAAQKLSLSHRKKSQPGPASPPGEGPGPLLYTGGFSGALQLSPPAIPPCLLRVGSKVKDKPGMGKVRVMVRICSDSTETTSLLKVDGRMKQLTLCEMSASGLASTACRRAALAPKTFVFDAVFPHDASQAEVCSGTVAEVIQSVVNGADGCIFGFGHVNLGKSYTMIGRDCSTQSLGVAPTAIAWLFKVMDERKEKSGAEVTVRVSAVEISGREETLTDLLSEFSFPSSSAGGHQEAPSPGVSLREDPLCGSQLQNQTELQATNAKQAAFFLDAALAARRSSQDPSDQESRRNSHFLFTLHLYQERLDRTNKAAVLGRSRLHLMDLGSCETDVSRTREGGGGQCLSLSALGNVILALANGAKHIPYRDSKLTMLLSESLGNMNCQTTMIAHISDSPATYMETLTTVQLASRIHRMRKKRSKYASSSSGGESSCEEGPSHRPPHLRPFHSRTVVLDPDIPLLLSSDTVYSSSSEHSCDTVIYIGPGGTAISDREFSNNEGPPSFVPIIPSLNKKRVKDSPRPVGDHFKCSTFAELQERLDFIDGSEGPAMFGTEGKTGQAAALRNQTGAIKPSEATAPLKSDKNSLKKFVESTTTTCANKTDPKQSPFPLESGLLDSSKIICTDGVKVSAGSNQSCLVKPSGIFSQNSEPVVREKVYLKRGIPNSSAPPFMSRASRAASQLVDVVGRTPPVGLSPQALKQGHTVGSSNTERVHHTSRCTTEVDNLQNALLGPCFERDFLSTAVTLQQPVELNGEDELVFTVIEELPHCLVPDKGRPTNLLSFNSDNSRHESASGVRPVSIISSINDEYDAYISQHGAEGSDVGNDSGKSLFPQLGNMQSTDGSWPREGDADSIKSKGNHLMSSLFLRDKNIMKENASTPTSPNTSFKQLSLQTGINSSLNDSGCFPGLDSNLATTNKLSLRKCSPSPDSTNVSLNFTLKMRAQVPQNGTLSSHPRKTKSASSGRQEGSHVEIFLQESSVDSREVEFLSACKPARNSINSSCSKWPGGNSNSIPRPLKAQASSSAERVVDGCDWSSTRRGDTLIQFSRLTRGATTLGTVSIPQVSESKWGYETTTGSLRFSSLGKQLNGQKSIVNSRSGYISSPAPPISQLSHDQKSRTLLSSSALKSSNDFGRSSSPKISTSEEEVNLRLRRGSFCHRSSNVKTENGSSRTSSLKTRGAKAESSRYYGSLISLERCVNQTLTGSKPELFRENSGASLANNRTNRSVRRLGVPATSSRSASPSQDPYAIATTIKVLGQTKGNSSSRAAVSGGTKVRSLSTSCSKSHSSLIKPFDNVVGRPSSLPSTVKSPSCSGTGAKTGKGTVMGTKQALSRAANSRVSELATGGQGKQLIGGPGAAGNDAVNSVNSSISGSLLNTPLPSPYSKITAPRRPQRYSSGHGSDNSSILSGELPPAMGRTALFYHSGGSSGYESMIRDSETTGSTSSAHDSMSESGVSSSNKSRVSKSPRKRGNGFQRRRLIPAPLPDTSTLGRRVGGQWMDLPQLSGTQKEPFEIKVYEIDNMEHLQRKREVVMDTEQPFQDVEKGLLYFNARLRMLEKRQQQIMELKSKHDGLKMELKEAKSRLMLNSSKWSSEFDVDQDLDRESQEYLEALAQATAELEYCVNLCKSHIMMETCFDIAVTTAAAATQREQQEVEV